MAVQFKIPKSPAKSIFTIDNFQGVDFTNSPANIDPSKSPNSVNMIRDVPGKVRKCMGYETIATYKDSNDDPEPINGYHLLRGDHSGFIHAGTSIYWDKIWLYDAANNRRSKAWQFEKKLYMLDGKELLCLYSEKQNNVTTTTGYHSRYIDHEKTFSETVTLKNNDYVNFYMPYECSEVEISYNGTTVTESLADVEEYRFENTYGDYEFELTFTGNTETTTTSLTRGEYVNVGVLGLNSPCTFTLSATGPERYITSIDFQYTDDSGTVKTFTITPSTQSLTYSWVNNIGDYEFSVRVNDNLELDDSGRLVVGEWSDVAIGETLDIEDILGEDSASILVGDELYLSMPWLTPSDPPYIFYSYTETRDGTTRTIYIDPEEDMPVRHLPIKGTPYGATISALSIEIASYSAGNGTAYYIFGTAPTQTVTIENYYGLDGDSQYVVNQALTNGFIDDRSGGYIDEDGYIHKVERVADNAYTPTLTISKDPEGGGESYEDLNLLNPAFTELFLGKPNVVDYNMSFDGLDETEPEVYLLDGDGEWQKQTYGTDFTCDYETGVITFTTAPGESPVTGEDNVKITAYRTVEGYADRINKCTIGILYGVNGASDRLFVSGNPDYINYDWYSGQYDPTYFTDTSYSMLGTSGSAIIGYSIISNYLAAHKDYMEPDKNIILREGDLVESEPSFRIINTLQGAGAIAPYSFAYLATEPLFLTKQGVYAVTAQDITGEKYAQNRSYFLDGKLLEEPNLESAYGFVHKDLYWLCLNGVAYILDGLQPIQTDRSMPYATRQYVGFYRTNLPARIMWEEDDALYFGTEDGRVCKFFTDKYALASYNDDGEPIEAIWETPDIDGKLFYKNKTLRYIALRLDSALATSVNIWVMNRGLWQFLKKDDTSGRYFSFEHMVFSKLSFSGDKTQHTISTKVRVKKVDKFRLRVTNDDLNEPFGLFNIAFEYVENGNYKG